MIYQHSQRAHGPRFYAIGPQVFVAAVYDSEAIFLSPGGSRVLPYHDIPGSVLSDVGSFQYRWPSWDTASFRYHHCSRPASSSS